MDKACSVVMRAGTNILAFRHPLTGLQLIKGGVDVHEQPAVAAEGELHEEFDVSISAKQDLGSSTDIVDGDRWHFWPMAHKQLSDHWCHKTADDGGHAFEFFWQPLNTKPPTGFAAPYQRALRNIAQAPT